MIRPNLSVEMGLFNKPESEALCTTMRGDKVKSMDEKRIADYFYESNVRYVYEKAARAGVFRKVGRPAFYLSSYDLYVEYWGAVSDKHAMHWKMAQYYENKIRLISLYPEDLDRLDVVFRRKFKEVTGMSLPPAASI